MEWHAACGTVRAMAVVLSISSQVARGHVGNSAVAPGLRALGHEVWPVPTVVLSNHPGHGAAAGFAVGSGDITAMLDQLEQHGWLKDCDAVLTGYFRDRGQCGAAAERIADMKSRKPGLIYCCDPVLGDDPAGLYVPQDVAAAVRDTLLPLADLATPNRFELAWLSDCDVTDARDALSAARKLAVDHVAVTSVAGEAGTLTGLWLEPGDAHSVSTPRLENVPHGVGDLFAGLATAHLAEGQTGAQCLALTVAEIAHVIAKSRGHDEIDMAASLPGLAGVAPAAITRVA